MPDPFKIRCHCGFETEDPQAMVDHCLATQHLDFPVGEADGSVAEFVRAIATIQQFGEAEAAGRTLALPEGMEINPVSVEDILTDDELSDEEKQDLLARLKKAGD